MTERLPVRGIQQSAVTKGTGWESGGEVTINADNTKFDVAAGSGWITDASDPVNITTKRIAWGAKTAVVPTFLATNLGTFLAIDENGAIVQDTTFPAGGVLRDCIQLGGIVHGNNTNISVTTDFISATNFQMAAALTDLQTALGVINTGGNVFSGDPAQNLKFAKSAGTSFFFGINTKVSPNISPNNTVDGALTAPQVTFSWKDGAGGHNSTVSDAIVAGVFDDNSGGDANGPTGTVTTNNWMNVKIRFSPDFQNVIIEYGTVTYNSSANAVAGIPTDNFGDNPTVAGVPVRGYLSIRGAAADLTLSGDGVFTATDKFGEI